MIVRWFSANLNGWIYIANGWIVYWTGFTYCMLISEEIVDSFVLKSNWLPASPPVYTCMNSLPIWLASFLFASLMWASILPFTRVADSHPCDFFHRLDGHLYNIDSLTTAPPPWELQTQTNLNKIHPNLQKMMT